MLSCQRLGYLTIYLNIVQYYLIDWISHIHINSNECVFFYVVRIQCQTLVVQITLLITIIFLENNTPNNNILPVFVFRKIISKQNL